MTDKNTKNMKSNTNIHRLPFFKLSLLAISLFIMMSAVISPALPLMMHAFPTISHVKIELLTTIPNLGMIFGLLISPFSQQEMVTKRIILISLLIVGVMGTLPVILNNYLLILISRIFRNRHWQLQFVSCELNSAIVYRQSA